MRRAWVILLLASTVVASGCLGRKSYEERLEKTLAKLEYERRLKKNLMDPPAEKKFQELAIYVRAPKEEALAKTGQLPVGEGQFDLDASFNDKTDSTMHMLARVKLPKKAPAKGAPPVAAPPARGEFVGEVLGVLSNVFGSPEALQAAKPVEENKKGNRFKRVMFASPDGKEVKVYTIKEGIHEVALIFVYDPKLKGLMAGKIDLCLESFAIGPKATRLYSNGGADEEADTSAPAPL